MKKVTKRLLVACVAALAVGACQDSVTIVEPAPPPPPPPPATVDATVTIQGLRLLGAGGAADPTNITSDINVVLNVEEGDNTVTGIALLFDDAPFTCQTINTNMAPAGEGLSLSTAGSADEVECFWDTNAFTGTCGVDRLDPTYTNGTHTLGARITLSDGTTREADNEQTVTLANSSFISVVHFVADGDAGGQGIIGGTNGRAYYGGPNPLPDATPNTVQFAACPVSYNGTQVGKVNLTAMADPAGDADANAVADLSADLGAGNGAARTESFPFLFTAGDVANLGVEDDGFGLGHTLAVGGSVFSESGLNVTSEFAGNMGMLTGMWLDFTGPTIGAGSTIQIDAVNVITGAHYSDEGPSAFNLSATVMDFGVGIGGTVGTVVYNINDCDGPACGSAGNTVVIAGATAVTDVGEDDNLDNADTNGLDTYEVDLISVADELSNVASAAQLANVINDPAGPIGADYTEAAITALLPPTDPSDSPIFVLNDTGVNFDAADVALASGDVGSGVDITGCNPCTAITATDEAAASYTVNGIGGITFEVDISTMLDAQKTLTLAVPDLAVLLPNVANDDYTFILDTTAPFVKPFTDFESSTTLAGSAAVFDLAGQITDGDGVDNSGTGSPISALTVGIWIDTNASLNADCGTTVATDLTTTGLTVDNQLRSIADTDGGELDFTMNTGEDYNFDSAFTVTNPGAGNTVTYCTIVTATDTTADRNGTANSNTGSNYNRFTITWQ